MQKYFKYFVTSRSVLQIPGFHPLNANDARVRVTCYNGRCRGRNFWFLGKRCSQPSLIRSLSPFLLSSTITISCIDCSCNEPHSRLIWQGLWNCFLILHSKENCTWALLHHYTEEIALTSPPLACQHCRHGQWAMNEELCWCRDAKVWPQHCIIDGQMRRSTKSTLPSPKLSTFFPKIMSGRAKVGYVRYYVEVFSWILPQIAEMPSSLHPPPPPFC